MARSVWPTTFRLRRKRWQIVYCDATTLESVARDVVDVSRYAALGLTDTCKRTIYVLCTLRARKKRRVLWHEINHAKTINVPIERMVARVRDHEAFADYMGDLDAEIDATLR